MKISKQQLVLTILSTTTLLISNIIAAKQIQTVIGILPAAVIVFPITYILSDVFSEVYGYKWSRMTYYIAFAMNAFMALAFTIAYKLPPSPFWNLQEEFGAILGSTPRMLVASIIGYFVGDLVNDIIFKKMKERHPDSHKRFGLRAIVSSAIGNLSDSLVFLPIAFYGEMPIYALVKMMFVQANFKTAYEFLILPLTTLVVKKVSKLEQEEIKRNKSIKKQTKEEAL